MMTIEPRLLAPWMAAQQKEAFDIALPLQILESLQGAIRGGVIDDPQNTYKHGKLLPVVALNEKLYQYLESLGIESEGLQHFVIQNALGRADLKSLPRQFLNALIAGSGGKFQQWKDHIVSNGWHRDKPFYRELLSILIEEIALIPVEKQLSADKVIEEFGDVQQIAAATRAIRAIEEVLLGRAYKQPEIGFYADTLKSVLLEKYGDTGSIPKEPTLNKHLELERVRRGLNGVALPSDSLRTMLAHIVKKSS